MEYREYITHVEKQCEIAVNMISDVIDMNIENDYRMAVGRLTDVVLVLRDNLENLGSIHNPPYRTVKGDKCPRKKD